MTTTQCPKCHNTTLDASDAGYCYHCGWSEDDDENDPKSNPQWEGAMKSGIAKHCQFCDIEPEDLSNREIKDIAERASVPKWFAAAYVNHWYKS